MTARLPTRTHGPNAKGYLDLETFAGIDDNATEALSPLPDDDQDTFGSNLTTPSSSPIEDSYMERLSSGHVEELANVPAHNVKSHGSKTPQAETRPATKPSPLTNSSTLSACTDDVYARRMVPSPSVTDLDTARNRQDWPSHELTSATTNTNRRHPTPEHDSKETEKHVAALKRKYSELKDFPSLAADLRPPPLSPVAPGPLVINHTRKCRQKVNTKFDELVTMMPDFKEDGKTKAKILDHATSLIRKTLASNAHLETRIALSSQAALSKWVFSSVSGAQSMEDSLFPILSLICSHGHWKYSELWTPRHSNPQAEDSQASLHLVRHFVRQDLQRDQKIAVSKFALASQSFPIPAGVGAPGRCFWTRQPEWLPTIDDSEIFLRSALVTSTGLVCGWSVPIIIDDVVVACLSFFDSIPRVYDAHCVHAATRIGQTLVMAYRAKSDRSAVVPIPEVDIFD